MGMKNRYRVLTVVACAVLVSACTSTSAGNPMLATNSVSTEGLHSDCFYIREVVDWEPLTTTNIVVYAPRSRPYLLTFAPAQPTLRSSINIAYRGANNRICGFAGDRILIGGGGGRDYAVLDVRRLDAESLEQLLADKAAYGKARRGVTVATPPQPGSHDNQDQDGAL